MYYFQKYYFYASPLMFTYKSHFTLMSSQTCMTILLIEIEEKIGLKQSVSLGICLATQAKCLEQKILKDNSWKDM